MTSDARLGGVGLSLLLLGACDTGTPGYWSVDPVRVDAGGMTFDVRVKDLTAEALRQGVVFPPPRAETVGEAAALAIAQVSGCEPLQLQGDPSIVQARLRCGDRVGPKFKKKRAALICDVEPLIREPEEVDDYYIICR